MIDEATRREHLKARVKKRVEWWLNDMAFKPPELLSGKHGEHYYECMAEDIACEAVGEIDDSPVMSRLDPPR